MGPVVCQACYGTGRTKRRTCVFCCGRGVIGDEEPPKPRRMVQLPLFP